MIKRTRTSSASVKKTSKSVARKAAAKPATKPAASKTATRKASTKPAASKTAARKASTKKAASKTATRKAATKAAANKTAARKASANKTAARKASTKAAASKTAPRKASAKTAARKTATRKALTKLAASKSAARKTAAKLAANKGAARKATDGAAVRKSAAAGARKGAGSPVAAKSARKAPAGKRAPVQPALQATEPAAYSLSELVARYGEATAEEVFARVDREPLALVDAGSQVATSRIDTDCARLYGRAGDFYNSASPQQRQALRGFSPELLRLALWSARHGQQLFEQRRLASDAGTARQEQRQVQAQSLRQQALARRDQLAALLRLAAGGNSQHGAEIMRAYGRIASPEELAQALDDLTKLGRRYLSGSDAALTRRAAAAGLDAAYLDEAAALAKTARAQLRTAEAPRGAAEGSQSEVDLWDGVNLFLLASVIELFDVANQLDPTVPRLIPLALRTWFGRSAAVKKPKAPAPEPTAPPAPEAVTPA